MRTELFFLGLSLAGALPAGSSFYLTVPVQAGTGLDALNAQAPSAAGLLAVRHQIPGEYAVQLAGPDGPGAGRIFTRPSTGSYALADVGSQWTSGIGQGQTVLGLLETYPGQFGWAGKAFVGAFRLDINKPELVSANLAAPPVLMLQVPVPILSWADASAIALTLPAAVDPSGLIGAWALWRKDVADQWENLSVVPFSGSDQVYVDTSVQAGKQYRYGLSARLDWPGGGQAGALPAEPGILTSNSRSESNWIAAAKIQPSPTPFPDVVTPNPTPDLGSESWIAYPNPNRDGILRLAFRLLKKSSYKLSIYGIDGTLVLAYQGQASEVGWQLPTVDLRKLASGIYLAKLQTEDESGLKNSLPLRKLAIIR